MIRDIMTFVILYILFYIPFCKYIVDIIIIISGGLGA